MTCAESRELWQRGLDGEPIANDAAAELDAHLAACRACRDLHSLAGLFSPSRLAFDRPAPPIGLSERVVRSVLARRRARRRRVIGLAAMAASLLIAGLTFAGFQYFDHAQPVPQIAQQDSQVPQPVRGPERQVASVPLDRSVQDAGEALVALTRRTADETLSGGRSLLPDVGRAEPVNSSPLLKRTLETPAQSFREASTALSTGLEPVASSARRAVQLFWQDVSPSAVPAGRGL